MKKFKRYNLISQNSRAKNVLSMYMINVLIDISKTHVGESTTIIDDNPTIITIKTSHSFILMYVIHFSI